MSQEPEIQKTVSPESGCQQGRGVTVADCRERDRIILGSTPEKQMIPFAGCQKQLSPFQGVREQVGPFQGAREQVTVTEEVPRGQE